MVALVPAGVVSMVLSRNNVVSPRWLDMTALLLLFPIFLLGLMAMMLRQQALTQGSGRKAPGFLVALGAGGMFAFLPVVIAGTLADRFNRTPHVEPATLVAYQNNKGGKTNCRHEVGVRRADGDHMYLCRSQIVVEGGIVPGSTVRLEGRDSMFGFAIDAVRRQ